MDLICVCVLHVGPFFVLVDVDIQHTAVSALILHPIEIQALWSQNYDTGSRVVDSSITKYNAMPLCWAII